MPIDLTDTHVDDAGRPADPHARPWLGVRFVCGGAYLRVYRNRAGNAYTATCPRCAKQMRFLVRDGGTDRRFFEVSCDQAR